MQLDYDRVVPYNGLRKEYEAESDIKERFEGMGGLMSDTPILFVVKTFKGVN